MGKLLTLKQIYLNEGAKNISDANSEGLGLYFTYYYNSNNAFFLVDTRKIIDLIRTFDTRQFAGKEDLLEQQNNLIAGQGVIKGGLGIRNHSKDVGQSYGTKTVAFVAAQPGYGPLLYDIALTLVPGLSPDRRSVSTTAKGVWDFYLNNRSDVEKKPYDDKDKPKTKTKVDDSVLFKPKTPENSLNYAYFSKGKLNIKQLEKNYAKLFSAAFKEAQKTKFLKNKTKSPVAFKAYLTECIREEIDQFWKSKYTFNKKLKSFKT